jgi:hypothetical protein
MSSVLIHSPRISYCKAEDRNNQILLALLYRTDLLCGLVIRVPGYRPIGPGIHSRRYWIFGEAVGLERSPLSLVRITEKLLERRSSGPGLENRD